MVVKPVKQVTSNKFLTENDSPDENNPGLPSLLSETDDENDEQEQLTAQINSLRKQLAATQLERDAVVKENKRLLSQKHSLTVERDTFREEIKVVRTELDSVKAAVEKGGRYDGAMIVRGIMCPICGATQKRDGGTFDTWGSISAHIR
ncbi:hypothetical protein HK097_010011 [Rhizophlyctis rosea]|uniref:Uncharacterized protein n=1 Tax=Rhizophlyctis rosea TaxID=64517 RepID=A0AAD5SPF7_9FUNG|nr:hypothetical protein HK097_010011 [Rhizophlyctis rosea]